VATLAFAAGAAYLGTTAGVGTLAAGGIAATALVGAATAAGAYVDQAYLYPAVFGKPPQPSGPRLDELALQTASEGAPIRRALGQGTRIAGNIIWVNEPVEHVHEVGGGKGGGPGGNSGSIVYTYTSDIAVGICEGPIDSGALKQIIVEGKRIYQAAGTIQFTSDELAVVAVTIQGTPTVTYAVVSSPSTGPDLSQFVIGTSLTASGFTNGANNGSWNVIGTTGVAGATTSVVLANSSRVAEAAGATATLTQTITTQVDTKYCSGVSFYRGDQSQTVDPLIGAAEGTTIAFRKTAYAVIEELNITEFGNRIPQIHFIVEPEAGATYQSVIEDIAQDSGYTGIGTDIVISDSRNQKGYLIAGPDTGAGRLDSLLAFGHLISRESGETIEFFQRENATPVTTPGGDPIVDYSDLWAPRESDAELPDWPYRMADLSSLQLPAEVTFRYVDIAALYQYRLVRERSQSHVANSIDDLEMAISAEFSEAEDFAKRVLWTRYANRLAIEFQWPPSMWFVQPGDVLVNVPLENTADSPLFTVLLSEVRRGTNGIVNCRGLVEEVQTL